MRVIREIWFNGNWRRVGDHVPHNRKTWYVLFIGTDSSAIITRTTYSIFFKKKVHTHTIIGEVRLRTHEKMPNE